MRIGMSLRGHGYHLAAWRHPDVPADASVRLDHYVHTAQTAERGKCDLIFFADGLGIRERDVPHHGSGPRSWLSSRVNVWHDALAGSSEPSLSIRDLPKDSSGPVSRQSFSPASEDWLM
jgi:hypothetical protein